MKFFTSFKKIISLFTILCCLVSFANASTAITKSSIACDPINLNVSMDYANGMVTITADADNAVNWYFFVDQGISGGPITSPAQFTFPMGICEDFSIQLLMTCANGMDTGWNSFGFSTPCEDQSGPQCPTPDPPLVRGDCSSFELVTFNLFGGQYRYRLPSSSDFSLPVNQFGIVNTLPASFACQTVEFQVRNRCFPSGFSDWSDITSFTFPAAKLDPEITVISECSRVRIEIVAPGVLRRACITVNDVPRPCSPVNTDGTIIFNEDLNHGDVVCVTIESMCNESDVPCVSDEECVFIDKSDCFDGPDTGDGGDRMMGESSTTLDSKNLWRASDSKFAVYPNPFDENITIEFELNTDSEVVVQLYSAVGILVLNKQLTHAAGSAKLNIQNDLPIGTYYYRAFFNERWHTGKIMKISKK